MKQVTRTLIIGDSWLSYPNFLSFMDDVSAYIRKDYEQEVSEGEDVHASLKILLRNGDISLRKTSLRTYGKDEKNGRLLQLR